jgi:hypothetical protein
MQYARNPADIAGYAPTQKYSGTVNRIGNQTTKKNAKILIK